MVRWKKIVSWASGLILIIGISAFSSGKQKKVRVLPFHVLLDYDENLHFISVEDIEELVRKEYPDWDSLMLREINIPMLEESIDNHPSIRKAEVYSKLNGEVEIKVWQKRPLARVQNSTSGFYIDEEGDSMQLSPRYSARVLMIEGNYKAEEQPKIFNFLKEIEDDEFYDEFFSGLQITESGEWILYPKPGNHKVLIGPSENIDGKLKKLKIFYQAMVNEENIDSIKTINLQYKGQVICRKHI